MAMMSLTTNAPGSMAAMPASYEYDEVPQMVPGGGGGGGGGFGTLTLRTGSSSNVKFRLDGASAAQSDHVDIPADGQPHTVYIDVYYK